MIVSDSQTFLFDGTPRKKKSRYQVIREGDIVILNTPREFIRAGYPLTKKEAVRHVVDNFSNDIDGLINKVMGQTGKPEPRDSKIIAQFLGYLYLKSLKFEGIERVIYEEELPEEAAGSLFTVESIDHTTIGHYSQSGIGLSNRKYIKILDLKPFYFYGRPKDMFEFEGKILEHHVRKIGPRMTPDIVQKYNLKGYLK